MMRRLVIAAALSLCCGTAAFAQIPLTGAGAAVGSGTVASYTGLVDTLGSPTEFWGLQAASAAVAAAKGNSLSLRRGSDNATCTAPVWTDGNLDLTDTAVCNSNTQTVTQWMNGDTAFASQIYGQINAKHGVQATTTKQCQLFLSGGPSAGQPYLGCVLANAQFYVATITTVASPYSYLAIADRTGSTTTTQSAIGNSGAPPHINWTTSANTINLTSSGLGVGGSLTANDNTWHVFQGIINGASSHIYSDGAAGTNGSNSTASGTTIGLATSGGGTTPLDGRFFGAVMWPVDASSSSAALNTLAHSNAGF